MLRFYDVDPAYVNYLRQFDCRVPNILYKQHDKFVCGIILSIKGYNYFAPISSNKTKQQANILILDNTGNILSSIKFNFMFPAPGSVITYKDFKKIRAVDSSYANLLEKEYRFCVSHEQDIRNKAMKIYKIGCNPSHVLNKFCCNFSLLESKCTDWIISQSK